MKVEPAGVARCAEAIGEGALTPDRAARERVRDEPASLPLGGSGDRGDRVLVGQRSGDRSEVLAVGVRGRRARGPELILRASISSYTSHD
jgi:hypothetical protein